MFDKVFTEIVDTLKAAGERGLANELQERGAAKSNPKHLFGLWLATAATTTRPATWEDFVQLLIKGGLVKDMVRAIPGCHWDSHQTDVLHVSARQLPQITAKAEQELSTKQVDQPKGVCSSSLLPELVEAVSSIVCTHIIISTFCKSVVD